MLRKTSAIVAAMILGGGASVAVAACGEDRGEVQVETAETGGGATGTSGTETGSGTETSGGSATATTETGKTETSP